MHLNCNVKLLILNNILNKPITKNAEVNISVQGHLSAENNIFWRNQYKPNCKCTDSFFTSKLNLKLELKLTCTSE